MAVNAVCEQFESDRRAGRHPRIEDAVANWTDPGRSALLAELIALEIELRRGRAERPTHAEYVERFRDDSAVVSAVFDSREVRSFDDGATIVRAHTVTAAPDDSACDPSSLFGEYELGEEIGRGGMGIVFKARHRKLNRIVALKMSLNGHYSLSTELERFRLEAEVAANLDHPNIVPVYDEGEHGGRLFFSMKLVEGGSLAQEISRFLEDPLAAARLLAAVARAIHFAHTRGAIHCDLKPANILLDEAGQPHVTDFGLARRFGSDSALTATGALLGTPSYMAPEQASGSRKELTPAADIYGLGAILYELLTGQPPFRAPSVMETVVLVLEREPEPPRSLRASVPVELEQICLKCLEKSPKERYPSAHVVAESLEQFLRGEAIAGTTIWQRLRRWTRREPELVSRLGGLGLMIALTQYNYATAPHPRFKMHYAIQSAFFLWGIASVFFQTLLRRGYYAEFARFAWSATDMIALTSVLYVINGQNNALIVGYPLLIAASGLWFRVPLVWFTTGLAMAAYSGLILATTFRQPAGVESNDYPNIFLAALLVTGFVVARQVKRFWALSRYYEIR